MGFLAFASTEHCFEHQGPCPYFALNGLKSSPQPSLMRRSYFEKFKEKTNYLFIYLLLSILESSLRCIIFFFTATTSYSDIQ